MANFIYSQVTIEPQEAMDKICNMIESMPSVEYGKETTEVVKTFYTEEEISAPYNNGETEYPITESGVKHGWLYDNVGTKWIIVGVDDDIRIESPSYIPDGFLIKLYNICASEFNDVKLTCKWYEETETNCGTAVIWNGIYTEDEEYLEDDSIYDPAYEPSGDEDLDDLKEWMESQIEEHPHLDYDPEEMSEDDLREFFEDWKRQSKWDYISEAQERMYNSCEEAIETEDFDFPVSKIKRISDTIYN